MQRGNVQEAIQFWSQALTISPALVLVRTNLATALLRTGHADEAQAALRQALEFQPSLHEARDLLNSIAK
jgi:Flp pilus assembly protein TadD